MLLWVAGWFPNSENPYNGIFIHRHAQAVANSNANLTVLTFATYFFGENRPTRLQELTNYQWVFVAVPQFKGKAFKIVNFMIYYWVTLGKFLQVILECQPQIVHVHAADKIGFVAAFWKPFFNYKLWLTEHWAIFNDWVPDRFDKRNGWFQKSYRYLWNKTDFCASINLNLHQSMEQTLGSNKKHILFPNALDAVFENAQIVQESGCYHFLHVSNFEPRKNTNLIIEAFKEVHNQIPQVRLTLVGISQEKKDQLFEEYPNLKELNIDVFEAVPAEELTKFYQQASAFILASDSENAPCVISEALAMGVPVIASNVGGISEMVNSENGILMEDWNPQENNSAKTLKITAAMLDFCKKCENFDRLLIQQNAKLKYSSESIAQQLIQQYTCAE
jgi:glycosyltransferase involved in cell wall biosynthesis